jgi:hypothetical protein
VSHDAASAADVAGFVTAAAVAGEGRDANQRREFLGVDVASSGT